MSSCRTSHIFFIIGTGAYCKQFFTVLVKSTFLAGTVLVLLTAEMLARGLNCRYKRNSFGGVLGIRQKVRIYLYGFRVPVVSVAFFIISVSNFKGFAVEVNDLKKIALLRPG